VTVPAKILVVDDTPHNVKLLADLLSVKGYGVATAATGEEALAKLPAEKPDLILLDVMMPGLSGYDVCRKIRDRPGTRTGQGYRGGRRRLSFQADQPARALCPRALAAANQGSAG
jgi:CheY-like chemotaxis protein